MKGRGQEPCMDRVLCYLQIFAQDSVIQLLEKLQELYYI